MADPHDETLAESFLDVSAGRSLDPTLVVVHHPDSRLHGARRSLRPGDERVMGRGSDLLGVGALEDGKISRNHCLLTYADGRLLVRDQDSRNGTFVDGRPVREAELKAGSLLGVGRVQCIVQWEPTLRPRVDAPGWVGDSVALASLLESVTQVAPLTTTVLVLGETGTGKELVARELHRRSGVKGKFVAVNCGGIRDELLQSELFGHVRGAFSGAERTRTGLIEEAHDGTLFLDEIGEASPSLQASLLRVLQEREVRPIGGNRTQKVTTRFVAATHQRLEDQVADGTFREDLYARLARWVVTAPPLRARREDVMELARHVAARVAEQPVRFHPKVAERLILYDWPRNVRELEAVVERLVVASGRTAMIRPDDAVMPLLPSLPAPEQGAAPRTQPAGRPGPEAMRLRLAELEGNVKAYALELSVGRNTLYRWLRQAGIDPASVRG
jgi:DNA-binding NtrC family response regulator